MNTLDYHPDQPSIHRTDREEFWNFATHATACLLSIGEAAVMIPAFSDKPLLLFLSGIVFSILQVALYACSALSHYFRDPRLRSLFRRLDQAVIYLFIAASYTPFSLAFQDDSWWWWWVLSGIWLLAIAGFVSKLVYAHRVEYVAVWIYLALGWATAAGGLPFSGLLPAPALCWMVLGGILYSAGTFFLIHDRRRWYFHAIWHLFVLAGSTTHFLAMMIYI